MVLMSIVLAVLMQAEPAAQAGRELTGVVVDAQGRPASGVAVLLSSLDRVDGENPTLGRTTSDPQGRFRLAMPAAWEKGAEIQFPTVWAYRPGASIGVAALRSSAASLDGGPRTPADAPIKLTLGAPEPVAVRVLDPQGRPVGAARIAPLHVEYSEKVALFLASTYRLPIPGEIVDRLIVQTDAQGVGEIAGLPAVGLTYVRVTATRFGTQTVTLQGKPSRSARGSAGCGRTVGRSGQGRRSRRGSGLAGPGRDASEATHPGNPFVYSPDGAAEVIIDASGRFEVPALAAGMLSLSLRTRDDKPALRPPRRRPQRSRPARPPS